jgi:hypothetical protein
MPTPDQIRKAKGIVPGAGSAIAGEAGPKLADVIAAGGTPVPDLNATQAGTLALSGSDVAVAPTSLEESPPAFDPTTAHLTGDLGLQNKDIAPTVAPATGDTTKTPTPVKSVGPVVAKAAPTTKEMIASLLKHTGPEGELVTPAGVPAKAASDFNFADLLKGAGGKLGDFLQRWGMGLQGAPTGQTQGDIQRAQEFEIKKQQAAAQVQVGQMALENKYQMERMNLQNQMNLANLPVEKKAELANSMAVLDAQFQNEMKMLPAKIRQEYAIRGMAAGADPGAHFVGGG